MQEPKKKKKNKSRVFVWEELDADCKAPVACVARFIIRKVYKRLGPLVYHMKPWWHVDGDEVLWEMPLEGADFGHTIKFYAEDKLGLVCMINEIYDWKEIKCFSLRTMAGIEGAIRTLVESAKETYGRRSSKKA